MDTLKGSMEMNIGINKTLVYTDKKKEVVIKYKELQDKIKY